MKELLKLFDYFFVLRPTLFFPVWTIFLAGFFVESKFGMAATDAPLNSTHPMGAGQTDFLFAGLALTLLMGAVFILNQIMDRHTDRRNKKLFLIAQGHISPRAALIEAVVLIVPSLAYGFFFSRGHGLTQNMGVLFLAVFLLTGILYSFKPFSWKDRPILGLVGNVLGALLIFICGWSINGVPSQTMLVHALPYACAVAAVYLYTTLPDVQGDQEVQKTTFGIKYGFKTTIYVGLILELVALILALKLRDEIIFYPAFFSMLFFVWAAIKARMEDVLRAIKFPILLLAIAVSIKYRVELHSYLFFGLLVGVYVLSKLYYKLRFGIDYPNLSA